MVLLLPMHAHTWLKYNVEARHACLCALSIHAGKVVAEKDAVLFLSNSGNTPECVTAASILLSRGVHIFVVTGGQGVCAMCTNTHTMLIVIVYEYAHLFKYVSTCVPVSCTYCNCPVVCMYCFTLLGESDSELAKMCTASLVYGSQRSRELFGAVPTSSIIVQVGWNEAHFCMSCVCQCVCVCVCVSCGVSFLKSYSSQRLHAVTPGQLFPLWFSWLKLT